MTSQPALGRLRLVIWASKLRQGWEAPFCPYAKAPHANLAGSARRSSGATSTTRGGLTSSGSAPSHQGLAGLSLVADRSFCKGAKESKPGSSMHRSSSLQACRIITYAVASVIVRLGESPLHGHYRAVLYSSTDWTTTDDGVPPKHLATGHALLLSCSYLIFLRRLQ